MEGSQSFFALQHIEKNIIQTYVLERSGVQRFKGFEVQ